MFNSIINLNPDITKEISFFYYNGPTASDYVKIPLANANKILSQPTFDKTRKTVFFFHGWSEIPSVPDNYSMEIMAAAFMQSNSANFIVVNYENLVQHYYNIVSWVGYFNAVQNTTQIGTALGYFFKTFASNCACTDTLHLIEFSLGAQIISFVAAVYGDGKLNRITDLCSGIFMDAIHTDAGLFGFGTSYASVDFWPNFGISVQPACITNTEYKCSHYMSVRYYAETVTNVYALKAVQCNNPVMWSSLLCTSNNVTHVGHGISTATSKGDYYLKTNAASLYGISGDGGLSVT